MSVCVCVYTRVSVCVCVCMKDKLCPCRFDFQPNVCAGVLCVYECVCVCIHIYNKAMMYGVMSELSTVTA